MTSTFKIIYWLRFIAGGLFLLLGLPGIGFGIFAMIDPAGSRRFDDGNPGGIIPPWTDGLYMTIVWAAIFTFGLWLIIGGWRKRNLI